MRPSIALAIPFLVLSLAACADFPGTTFDLDELKTTTPTGSPFTQALAHEYSAFAQAQRDEYDWMASQYFAKKGLRAAKGEAVPPEELSNWPFIASSALPDLVAARARLVTVLAGEAPNRAPAVTATAEVKFDCWVEEQDEGWQIDDIAACRNGFNTAMDALQKAMQPAAAPAPAPQAEAKPMAPTSFMAFFDWDRSNLTPEARRIVDAAANAAKNAGNPKIKVTGYTDLSGPVGYNLRLSVRRADSVEKALVEDGVPAGNITTEGKGKSDPLVPTPDGVREPKNRRAVIDLLLGQ